ncbi:MAG: hypothetical protein L0Y42_05465 [Phycisphaerales bacterium]|nr:hypothetical protein [Phycisphaerales bacterium]
MSGVAEPLTGKRLGLVWPSTRRLGEGGGLERAEFCLSVEVQGGRSAAVEAWMVSAMGRRIVVPRQGIEAAIVIESEFAHFDAVVGGPSGWRLAVSLTLVGENGPQLVYAQTALLERAGFAAGRYGPPTMTMSSL